MITLTTTLYVDQVAFPDWALPELLDLYVGEYNPNDIVMVEEGERAALVKHMAGKIWEVGEFSYLLTSVPQRRYWAILPEHVHLLVRNENNSRPKWTGLNALDAWVYWAMGGMDVSKARERAKKPPKKAELVEACAHAWEMWEEVGVFNGVAERIREPLDLDYEAVEDLPGRFEDWAGQVMAVDIETTGLNPDVDEVIGVSVSIRERQGWWIPWPTIDNSGILQMPPHTRGQEGEERLLATDPPSPQHAAVKGTSDAPDCIGIPLVLGVDGGGGGGISSGLWYEEDGDDAVECGVREGQRHPPACPPLLRQVLESPLCFWVGWNSGFDWDFLNRKGVRITPPVGDGKALAYLRNLQHLSAKLELKALTRKLMKRQVVTYAGAVGDEDTLAGIDPKLLLLYGCQDSDIAFGMVNLLTKMMEELG